MVIDWRVFIDSDSCLLAWAYPPVGFLGDSRDSGTDSFLAMTPLKLTPGAREERPFPFLEFVETVSSR